MGIENKNESSVSWKVAYCTALGVYVIKDFEIVSLCDRDAIKCPGFLEAVYSYIVQGQSVIVGTVNGRAGYLYKPSSVGSDRAESL